MNSQYLRTRRSAGFVPILVVALDRGFQAANAAVGLLEQMFGLLSSPEEASSF